jgi:hypothetical protein
MDKVILDAWDKYNHNLKEYFKTTIQEEYNDSYLKLLTKTIEIIFPEDVDEYREYRLDPKRITQIDHGDYQGTFIFIIANDTYQPDPDTKDYWYTSVDYGSCSGCDTLQHIVASGNYEGLPDAKQIEGYWTLCLHMIQKIKNMKRDSE